MGVQPMLSPPDCFFHSQENSVPGPPSALDALYPASFAGCQWGGGGGGRQPSPDEDRKMSEEMGRAFLAGIPAPQLPQESLRYPCHRGEVGPSHTCWGPGQPSEPGLKEPANCFGSSRKQANKDFKTHVQGSPCDTCWQVTPHVGLWFPHQKLRW